MTKIFLGIIVYFLIGFVIGILTVRCEYMQSGHDTYEDFELWNNPEDTIFGCFFGWPIIVSMYSIITFTNKLLKFVCPDKKEEEE